jgi:hypothetical protein
MEPSENGHDRRIAAIRTACIAHGDAGDDLTLPRARCQPLAAILAAAEPWRLAMKALAVSTAHEASRQ